MNYSPRAKVGAVVAGALIAYVLLQDDPKKAANAEPVAQVAPSVAQVKPQAQEKKAAPEPEIKPFTAEETARAKQCEDKLKVAASLKMLHLLDWDTGGEPRVIVGPTFSDVAFDVKLGLVKTINCFNAGGRESVHVPFDLFDWKTNKKVGRYSALGELTIE